MGKQNNELNLEKLTEVLQRRYNIPIRELKAIYELVSPEIAEGLKEKFYAEFTELNPLGSGKSQSRLFSKYPKEVWDFISQNFVSKEEINKYCNEGELHVYLARDLLWRNINDADAVEENYDNVVKFSEAKRVLQKIIYYKLAETKSQLTQARKSGLQRAVEVLDKLDMKVLIELNDNELKLMTFDEYNAMIDELDEFDGIYPFINLGYVINQQPISAINKELEDK